MSQRLPPSFVPTLTEVVREDGPPSETFLTDLLPSDSRQEPSLEGPLEAPGVADTSLQSLEDQMVQRVLQRVDLTLERRLHGALAALLASHTRELMPHLRDEIEAVVRRAINEAVAQEMDTH